MPDAKSRLVGVIELPETAERERFETRFGDEDASLKLALRRLAAQPRGSSQGRSRLNAGPQALSPAAAVIYADLGQLSADLKLELASLQGRYRG